MSQYYIWVSLPGVIGCLQFQATKRFMMAMKVFHAITYFQVFLLLQHILTSALFIYVLRFGYLGAALATTTTNIVAAVGLSLVLKFTDLVKPEAFHFFNKDSFKGLKEYLSYGIPSMVMLVIEWVSFEMMGVYAGIVGVSYLGAHTIMSNLMTLFYMIPLGLSFATMAHIGHALGKGQYKLAEKYFRISYCISIVTGSTVLFIIMTFHRRLFRIYTHDHRIREVIYWSVISMAPLIFFGNLHGNMKGVFRSIGKQIEAALVTSFLYMIVGNGFSILLGFYFNMKLRGIWLGFGIA
jgi:MATE family multidrug resistance protein